MARLRVALCILGVLGTSGCRGESARIDGVLRAPERSAARAPSLAGIAVRLLVAPESLRTAVAARCERYLRADAALSDARFGERIGATARSRARTLSRFRALDDSAAAIERHLLADLDSIYATRTSAVAVADSAGAFSFRRVPPTAYALAATSIGDDPPYRWWGEIEPRRGRRTRVELARPTRGHLTCFDPERNALRDSVPRAP